MGCRVRSRDQGIRILRPRKRKSPGKNQWREAVRTPERTIPERRCRPAFGRDTSAAPCKQSKRGNFQQGGTHVFAHTRWRYFLPTAPQPTKPIRQQSRAKRPLHGGLPKSNAGHAAMATRKADSFAGIHPPVGNGAEGKRQKPLPLNNDAVVTACR